MNILSDDVCTYIAGFLSITDLGAVIQSKLNKAIQVELIRIKEKALYLVRWWKQNRVPDVNDIFWIQNINVWLLPGFQWFYKRLLIEQYPRCHIRGQSKQLYKLLTNKGVMDLPEPDGTLRNFRILVNKSDPDTLSFAGW